jgi:enamine deaminase RidA (YjgF/YER057c/UK114 family)
LIGEGDMYAQAKQAIHNIEKALQQAGASLSDVVRTRTFVTDMSRIDEVAKAHGEAFGDIRPAATLVEVKALVEPVMLVEIEADAIIP